MKKTAEERGKELLYMPRIGLPELAKEFAKHLCSKGGMCIEVLLTAYTVYAQCVEKLECTDELYMARPEDVTWFKEHKKDK